MDLFLYSFCLICYRDNVIVILQSSNYKVEIFGRIYAKKHNFRVTKYCAYCEDPVPLHRVFHGIRFKVK